MQKVKKFIAAGVSAPSAIREALQQQGLSVTAFALKHGLTRAHASNAINGTAMPSERLLDALVKELGGTSQEWEIFLYRAADPTARTSQLAAAAR